ncbi:hypothetical protein [Nocardioides sp. SYSU DS0651]|uniref:hypothetical protein n=1 Tax=Nocardioides sp. SYSU DS0651 TaxID=3415955 RepID=UPI003F4B6EB4
MKRYRVPTVALALAVSSVLALPGPSSDGSPGRPPADRPAEAVAAVSAGEAGAAAPLPADTRVGFTDEQDSLYGARVTRSETGGEFPVPRYDMTGQVGRAGPFTTVTGFAAEPVHEAELSMAHDGDSTAYVSTRDHPRGEVYLDYPHDGSTAQVRVTCDEFVEAHPVVDGRHVFFASDADGDWDIWLATGPPPPGPPARPAPGWASDPADDRSRAHRAAAASEPCSKDWTFLNLTGPGEDDQQDQWPTVTPDFPEGEGTGELVFSRSTDQDLADLWVVRYDDGDWFEPEVLVETPDEAETHPRIVRVAGEDSGTEEWIVHTSTHARDDGSLALRRLSDPETRVDPWAGGPRQQSSEAAWDGSAGRPVIAFRSTGPQEDRDPLGGIWLAELTWRFTGSEEPPELTFTTVTRVADDRRVAESHPAFLGRFCCGETPDIDLVFTARALRGPHEETTRLVDGDVSDALAADGSDRRVVVDARTSVESRPFRHHETAPSYTRDGRRMVYARSDYTRASGSEGFGEELVVANADGTDPQPLGDLTDHRRDDVDSDPEWSPDGRRIAFVRHRPNEFRRVFVYDVQARSLVRITPTGNGSGVEPLEDADPSWSPDGRRLVVARTIVDYYEFHSQELWAVPADGAGAGGPVAWMCEGPCPVEGRRPAWSPDGSRIVYEHHGDLLMLDIEGDTPDGGLTVAEPEVLVGLDYWDGETRPTEARYVVEAGDDPAWAPDGSEIAFAGQPVGQPDQRGIWAIEPDGSGLRSVTDERGPETEPAYRPGRPAATPTADVLVRVRLDEPVGYAGGRRTATVVVRNRGLRVAQAVTLRAVWPDHLTPAVPPPAPPAPATPECLAAGDPCALGSLAPGAVIRYDVLLATPAEGSGRIVARVSTTTRDVVPANNRAAVTLPVLQPTIRLVPAVARPGQVVMAYAENMPPGTSVGLRWSEGTVPEPGTLTVAEDGTARTSILFVRRDQLGERILTATSTTDEFAPVDGEILVTLRSMSPPDLVGRG